MNTNTTSPVTERIITDLLDLVGDIYQAGLEPEHWPAVLGRISQFFQADMACVYTPVPAFPEQAIYLTHNFSDSSQAHYAAYYHRHDAWPLAAQDKKIYLQGTLTLGEQLITQADLHRTEFYNDFLKPNGMEWIVTTALFDGLADPHTPATHMTFTRHPDHAAFGSEQTRLLEQLAPTSAARCSPTGASPKPGNSPRLTRTPWNDWAMASSCWMTAARCCTRTSWRNA